MNSVDRRKYWWVLLRERTWRYRTIKMKEHLFQDVRYIVNVETWPQQHSSRTSQDWDFWWESIWQWYDSFWGERHTHTKMCTDVHCLCHFQEFEEGVRNMTEVLKSESFQTLYSNVGMVNEWKETQKEGEYTLTRWTGAVFYHCL